VTGRARSRRVGKGGGAQRNRLRSPCAPADHEATRQPTSQRSAVCSVAMADAWRCAEWLVNEANWRHCWARYQLLLPPRRDPRALAPGGW